LHQRGAAGVGRPLRAVGELDEELRRLRRLVLLRRLEDGVTAARLRPGSSTANRVRRSIKPLARVSVYARSRIS